MDLTNNFRGKKKKNKRANKKDKKKKKPTFNRHKPLMTWESFLMVLSNSELRLDDESWAKGDT